MDKAFHHQQKAGHYYELGRFQEAIQEAEFALEEDPFHEHAIHILALCHGQLSDYPKAFELTFLGLQHHPNSSTLFYTMGVIHKWAENYPVSIRYSKKALEIEPDTPLYLLSLAAAYVFNDELPKAKSTLKRCLQLDPENVSALNLKGQIEAAWASKFEAERSIDKSLEINPEDAQTHFLKGRILWNKGDYPQAEKHFWQASTLDPDKDIFRACSFEAQVRSQAIWGSILNAYQGKSFSYLKAFLLLFIITIVPNVYAAKGIPMASWAWLIFIVLLIPPIVYWWIRPVLIYRAFQERFKVASIDNSNLFLPLDMLGALALLSTLFLWASAYKVFLIFWVFCLFAGLFINGFKLQESQYPVFQQSSRKSIFVLLGVCLISAVFLYLIELDAEKARQKKELPKTTIDH